MGGLRQGSYCLNKAPANEWAPGASIEEVTEMINGERLISRPLRWGMVGGGRTGQVGYKHRTGAMRDGNYQLVAGAFDLDVERGQDFGVNLGVALDRCYPDYKALIAGESSRKDGADVVSIATPNFTHYEITKACLEAGLHVICEKPLFFTVAECDEVAKLAEEKGLIVAGSPDGGDGQEGNAGRHSHRRYAIHPRL